MVTDGLQEEEQPSWTLPSPAIVQDRLRSGGDSLREYLEDVEMELLALAFRTAAENNVVNPAAGDGWTSAQRDLERVLAVQGCKFTIVSCARDSHEFTAARNRSRPVMLDCVGEQSSGVLTPALVHRLRYLSSATNKTLQIQGRHLCGGQTHLTSTSRESFPPLSISHYFSMHSY